MGDKGMETRGWDRGEGRRGEVREKRCEGSREQGQCHVEDVRYMMDTGWAGCFRVDV